MSYDDETAHVHIDGACFGNGTNNARAGIGVFWGEDHPLNVSEPVKGRATNNCGEIQAATRAIRQAEHHGYRSIVLYTDSQFLIKAATQWMQEWINNGWRRPTGERVKNERDFRELHKALHYSNVDVEWSYVPAHRGIYGNEMADQLAKAGANRYKVY